MEKAVDLLISGYSAGKSLLAGIFKAVDYFYDCTDVFDQSVSVVILLLGILSIKVGKN